MPEPPDHRAEATCPDCGVQPGQPHDDGCDIARCTECGHQRISCEHGDADTGWGAIYTGEWPGVAEARELGWYTPDGQPDLNRIGWQGGLSWNRDQQRWVKP